MAIRHRLIGVVLALVAIAPIDRIGCAAATPLLSQVVEELPAEKQESLAADQAAITPIAPNDTGLPVTPSRSAISAAELDEVIITGRHQIIASDPLERLNAKSFAITQSIDVAVIAPAARGYEKTVPVPIRNGLRNLLANFYEPVVLVNFLLQHHVGKGAETAGRILINSTIGVGGLFDLAKRRPFRLPHRPNSLADTLGFYGVKPGAYLFLPLVGPTTVRDLIGDTVEQLVWPSILGKPFDKLYFSVPVSVERTLDQRIAYDEELQRVLEQVDPYAARRELYLASRRSEIKALHGKSK